MDASKENNGFGPLAKKRGRRAVYASLLALVVSILFIRTTSCDLNFWIFSFALSFLAVSLGEMTIRLCLLAEELQHKNSRYGGSWKAVLRTTFSLNCGKTVIVCVAIVLVIVLHYLWEFRHSDHVSDYMALFFLNIGVVPLAMYLTGLRELSPIEVSELNERENKNVADGLAWCYYYGYLKLVLPHLEEQINKSEKYRRKIKVPRVFILLPKSCSFPSQGRISEVDDRIKVDGPLPELKITRGGIHERSYKHTVHRIDVLNREGTGVEEYYCIAEYVTLLRTLYEMSNNPKVALTREERDQQCMVFIRKLREILDSDDECRGKCELVTLSGEENDKDDERNKIGDILLRHLTAPKINLGI